jgi:hypothetical protein
MMTKMHGLSLKLMVLPVGLVLLGAALVMPRYDRLPARTVKRAARPVNAGSAEEGPAAPLAPVALPKEDGVARKALEAFACGSPEVRRHCLEEIADSSVEGRQELLTKAIDDPTPEVRVAAIRVLRAAGAGSAWIAPLLDRRFSEEGNVRVRKMIVDAIPATTSRRELARMLESLWSREGNPAVRRVIAVQIGSVAALDGLAARRMAEGWCSSEADPFLRELLEGIVLSMS